METITVTNGWLNTNLMLNPPPLFSLQRLNRKLWKSSWALPLVDYWAMCSCICCPKPGVMTWNRPRTENTHRCAVACGYWRAFSSLPSSRRYSPGTRVQMRTIPSRVVWRSQIVYCENTEGSCRKEWLVRGMEVVTWRICRMDVSWRGIRARMEKRWQQHLRRRLPGTWTCWPIQLTTLHMDLP